MGSGARGGGIRNGALLNAKQSHPSDNSNPIIILFKSKDNFTIANWPGVNLTPTVDSKLVLQTTKLSLLLFRLWVQNPLAEQFFKTLTVNDPSASISPVINQGFNLDLLLVISLVTMLDLAKLE